MQYMVEGTNSANVIQYTCRAENASKSDRRAFSSGAESRLSGLDMAACAAVEHDLVFAVACYECVCSASADSRIDFRCITVGWSSVLGS